MKLKYKNKHNIKVLLIGENLNEDLYYCVNHYGLFENHIGDYLYTLFNYSFSEGISFNYHNVQQYELQHILGDEKCQKDL